MAVRQLDFAFWLLAPLLVPSIYASYRDLFVTTMDPQPPDAAS